MAFSFTTRLDKGKNGTGSINGLFDSLVSAIASALTTGAVVGLRIVEVINHTDGTVVDKSTITAGVDKFVLASGNLATKKLFIRTLPASA